LKGHGTDAGPLPDPDDVLEITYTSGTTGNPKGAVFDHRAHLYLCDAVAARYHMDPDSSMFTVMPLFHAGGLRVSVLTVLMHGGHSIIGEFSLSGFWPMVRDHGVTHITTIDTIVMLLMKQPAATDDADNPIRYAMGNGAPELLNGFESRFDLDFIQAYGMTECGIVCTTPDAPRETIQRLRLERPGNNYVGRPLGRQTEVRVQNDEGKEVSEGEIGEFVLRSPGMLREYFEDSAGTRQILRDGWLYSGDLAFKGSDGSLYFVDRKKDMIRRSGENISPQQVEEVLFAHAGVKQATVFPVPDELRGEGVKAIVVLLEGATPSAEDLWSWCDERLAHYKVPRYIEFRDAIPMNASGKVRKHMLREEPIDGLGETFDRGDRRFKDVRSAAD
jgi:crotonobetaine/carnitine-CoA ligase